MQNISAMARNSRSLEVASLVDYCQLVLLVVLAGPFIHE